MAADVSGPKDIPADAKERLRSMSGDASHAPLFTSDLSVNEFLLVREAGFEPVGMVVGSSIYHRVRITGGIDEAESGDHAPDSGDVSRS